MLEVNNGIVITDNDASNKTKLAMFNFENMLYMVSNDSVPIVIDKGNKLWELCDNLFNSLIKIGGVKNYNDQYLSVNYDNNRIILILENDEFLLSLSKENEILALDSGNVIGDCFLKFYLEARNCETKYKQLTLMNILNEKVVK